MTHDCISFFISLNNVVIGHYWQPHELHILHFYHNISLWQPLVLSKQTPKGTSFQVITGNNLSNYFASAYHAFLWVPPFNFSRRFSLMKPVQMREQIPASHFSDTVCGDAQSQGPECSLFTKGFIGKVEEASSRLSIQK